MAVLRIARNADADGSALDPNAIEIDLAAVEGNLREIRRRVGPARKIIGVVKADAYGHGLAAIASKLARCGVDLLASGSLNEAIAIRRAGISTSVLLLGSLSAEAIPLVIANELIPTLDDMSSAEALSRVAPSPMQVFIKIDGGFGRFGVAAEEAPAFIQRIGQLPQLIVGGVYTHLPFSDDRGRAWAEKQTDAFQGVVAAVAAHGLLVPISQALASPGLLTGMRDRTTAVAMGSILYGMLPFGDQSPRGADASGFVPALQNITSKLLRVGRRAPGEDAAPYLRQHEGRIGVVSIGIHHGFRPMSPEACMIIDGSKVPILRVCLENTIIDLAKVPSAQVGDLVTVVGRDGETEIKLQDLAGWQNTSSLALLIGLSKSIPRHYIDVAP